MTENKKHICKFKRIKYKSGNQIFFCTLPDCNKKLNPALALGKRCICWRCGSEFILNEYSLRLVKPHCEKCHKSKSPNGNETFIPTSEIPSLADRLSQTIKQAQEESEEEI